MARVRIKDRVTLLLGGVAGRRFAMAAQCQNARVNKNQDPQRCHALAGCFYVTKNQHGTFGSPSSNPHRLHLSLCSESKIGMDMTPPRCVRPKLMVLEA